MTVTNTITTYEEAVEYCKDKNLNFNARKNDEGVFMWHVHVDSGTRFYASGHGESLLEAINDFKLSVGDFILKTNESATALNDEARSYLDTNDFLK